MITSEDIAIASRCALSNYAGDPICGDSYRLGFIDGSLWALRVDGKEREQLLFVLKDVLDCATKGQKPTCERAEAWYSSLEATGL
jgi:hypothetical protein